MHILIADDERVNQLVLKRALERLGHDCEVVANGEEAWNAYRDTHFDVVISDWMMPVLDGIDLCQRVREMGQEPYTYFVMVTSMDGRANLVAGMQAGVDDYITKPVDAEELRARLIAAERHVSLHRQLLDQRAELARLNKELYDFGRIDALTGVPNRQKMTEDLGRINDEIKRYGHSYAFALCDVDFFKRYNDTCGHQAGDVALRAVAQSLQRQNRASDMTYRYGGEEFLVVLPEQTPQGAAIGMERMRTTVERLGIPHPGKTPPGVITFSCGISIFRHDSEGSVDDVLRQADDALYRAKEQGRNCIVCYEPEPA